MSTFDLTLEPEPVEIRRFEVITGAGGRRSWPAEAKARIVAETLEPGANVSAIARRHGLRPQQIFTWRREVRRQREPPAAISFVPVVEAAGAVLPSKARRRRSGAAATAGRECGIELEIKGVLVRVRPAIDAQTLATVVRVLKAG